MYVGGLGASNILGRLNRKYLDTLNSFLRPVLRSSSQSSFLKCWHAKTDGWAASTFHSYCDGKGPTVTIIKVNNYIFGGYTDVPWSSPKPSKCDLLRCEIQKMCILAGGWTVELVSWIVSWNLSTVHSKCDGKGPTVTITNGQH